VVDLEAFASGDFEFAGVEAKLVKNGGVDVGDVVTILGRVKTNLIGGAMNEAAFEAAASHPNAERKNVVVASIAILRAGCAAKFRGEDDEGFVEQAALREVFEQAADGLIDSQREARMIFF
jgi:hypothetical protein